MDVASFQSLGSDVIVNVDTEQPSRPLSLMSSSIEIKLGVPVMYLRGKSGKIKKKDRERDLLSTYHALPSMNPELKNRKDDTHHERLSQVLHFRHGLDRQLAEYRKHVRVEKWMAEDLDFSRQFTRSQWAIAKPW